MHFDVMLPNQEASELISHRLRLRLRLRLPKYENTYPKDKNCVKTNILELHMHSQQNNKIKIIKCINILVQAI